jgi:hypothetical protein
MEQLVLLLVIAAISLANWLIERSAKLREKKRLLKEASQDGQPEPVTQPESAREPSAREDLEEHMRRMMESFGMPVEETRSFQETPTPRVVFEEPVAPPPPPLPVIHPRIRRSASKPSVARRPRSPWTARLGSSQGLREAIVLREILGPPKALSDS